MSLSHRLKHSLLIVSRRNFFLTMLYLTILFLDVSRLSLCSRWWLPRLSRRRNPPPGKSPSNRHKPCPARRKRPGTSEGCCSALTQRRLPTVHTPPRPSRIPRTATPTRTRPIRATPITPPPTARLTTWPRYNGHTSPKETCETWKRPPPSRTLILRLQRLGRLHEEPHIPSQSRRIIIHQRKRGSHQVKYI